MALSYELILRSRPIVFVVGPGETEYTVHAESISRLSKALRVLIDGKMKEATDGRVVWEDVDEQTFVRFTQWAYTNDYDDASPDILLDASSIQTQPQSANSISVEPEGGLYRIEDKAEKASSATKSSAMSKAFCEGENWVMGSTTFKPRPNKEACEDYTKVFFCHTNLYILADKYDITKLGQLSMHKLHSTLKAFMLYPSRMGDILSLVELVFNNTLAEDELRTMLVLYCTCIVENLAKCEEFQLLLQGCPEFTSALVAKMIERLD
ncbi:hypothetical protein PG985_004855 [Apiospora marii]|uniref:uncharacterized protein n=1 Tax=Apiospora marii TaxID=335849 RepID=UPI0031315383